MSGPPGPAPLAGMRMPDGARSAPPGAALDAGPQARRDALHAPTGQARRGLVLGAAAFLAWGLSAPLLKELLVTFSQPQLLAARFALALLILAPFMDRERWRLAIGILRTPRLLGLLALGTGIHFAIFLVALSRVEPAYATLGFFSAPLWTALVARLALGERMGRWFVPTVAAMAAGTALTVGAEAGVPPDGFGLALAIGSGLTWALYATGLRAWAPGLRLRPLMAASFLVGLTIFGIAAAMQGAPWPQPNGVDVVRLLLLAAIPTTASMLLFNAALQRAPAAQVNLLLGLELAATVFFSWLIVGQTFAPLQLAGVAIVLAAITAYLGRTARPGGP